MFEKKGKSKRGRWTPEQRAYAARLIENGCIACELGRGIFGTPAQIHHQKEGFHGAGMRAPHHHGLPLCHHYHLGSTSESVHLNPEGFRRLIGMSEAEAVTWCWERFGWIPSDPASSE